LFPKQVRQALIDRIGQLPIQGAYRIRINRRAAIIDELRGRRKIGVSYALRIADALKGIGLIVRKPLDALKGNITGLGRF
jgi:hypothetical protein